MSLSALIYNRNSLETAEAPKSEYAQILENVQQYMSQEHGAALSQALTEDDAQASVLSLMRSQNRMRRGDSGQPGRVHRLPLFFPPFF